MATYVVGDLQGCLGELQDLLSQVGFADEDRLWLVGDLVNRGPASLETLRFVQGLADQVTVVLGNHDLHLLATHHGVRSPSKSDTFDEILSAPDRYDLMSWLCSHKLLHVEGQWAMVHAGLPPMWSVDEALGLAGEVERVLHGLDPDIAAEDFFTHMYGDEPSLWRPELDGLERLRVITNYLTRMRLLNAQGALNLSHKGLLEDAPKGWDAWFVHSAAAFKDHHILFGHWAALDGHTGIGHIHALDTGCVWGRTMTAFRLEDQRLFVVPARA